LVKNSKKVVKLIEKRKSKVLKMAESYATVIFWIVSWFGLNMAITICNKGIFEFGKFYFPALLTTVHMFCSWIGGKICIDHLKLTERKQLDRRGEWMMFWISFIFTANIILGNVSLRFVSVAFNQLFRATVPAFTMALSVPLLKETFSAGKKLSMTVVIIGVMVSCYGDIEFTVFGFTITLIAVVTAAVKAVVSSMVLTGEYKLHPIDLLHRMSFYSTWQSLLYAIVVGEGKGLLDSYETYDFATFAVLAITGLLAFFLNIASFYVNKVTSALSLSIVANVKQVVVIALSFIVFASPVTLLNTLGVIIVSIGSAWYSYVGYRESENTKKHAPVVTSIARKESPTGNGSIKTPDPMDELDVEIGDIELEEVEVVEKETAPLIESQKASRS